MQLELIDRFSKNKNLSNLMKIRPVGAELFHMDGQTDMTKLELIDRYSKNKNLSNLMKIPPVGAELFHMDGQTDMTKLIVALGNFAKAPKNVCRCAAVKLAYI